MNKSYKKQPVQKEAGRSKLTLSLAVSLGKEPVLPQKLLEELLPAVQRALSKREIPVRLCRRVVSTRVSR
jgi:hypothetical protein